MSSIGDRLVRVLPGFTIGLLIGLSWPYWIFAISFLFRGRLPWYFGMPFLIILPVAIGFSLFRKHNVVSGILVIAIAFLLIDTHRSEQRAIYGVRQSGRSFSSAAMQHFRHVWRSE